MIVNPATGEHIRILLDGDDTEGSLLVFELCLPPGGHVPARHVHPDQHERFEVLQGFLRVRLGGRTRLLGRGDVATVEPGTPHHFSNPTQSPVLVRVEVRPALRTAEMLEAAARLGASPGPMRLARFLGEFATEVRAPILPGFVAAAARTLARLAGQSRAF